jgi:methylated-DNA-protein-cysteine methyltransferase-like protein
MNNNRSSTEFFNSVYELVRLIPKGRVTTYGAIAKCLGAPRSSRLVGYAMNNSHTQLPKVPAHRVVNRNGLLTGKHHFSTPFEMQELLKNEGILVLNNEIVNFKEKFWDPENLLDSDEPNQP